MSTAPSSTAFTAEDFRDIYPAGIERHYWNHARNRIIHRHISRLAAPGEQVLDVGCGTGIVTAFLRARGVECQGCDLGHAAPVNPATAPFLRHGIDACDLDVETRRRVRVITLLDVLEHVENPRSLLERLLPSFPALRSVFFTVPARMDIWSNYDERNRHFRRYDRRSVRDLEVPGALQLAQSSYFFHALYVPARLMKLLGIDRQTRLNAPRLGLLHSIIAAGFVLEERVIPAAWPGSSMYGILERTS